MKKRIGVFVLLCIVAAAMLAGCATKTFLVGKDGSYTFFGRLNTGLAKNLCATGELRTILDDASIPAIAKEGFYSHICTSEYNHDMVVSIYTFMTPEERTELMHAFERQGYEINLVHC